MSEELTLIDAAKAGSVGAFTELVGRYREGLLRFLITRCSSVADAEDALQDTMINAYRYLKSYDPRWRFSTWLYRIAIRNAAKQRRDSYAGVRVLPGGEGPAAGRSRETLLLTDDPARPRLLTVLGGKLTTHRATAARALGLLAPTLSAVRAQ